MRISGIVLDESGTVPVPFAVVEATQAADARPDEPWEATAETITDPGGGFTLEGLSAGPVLLRAVPADDEPGVAVELTATAGATDLRVVLRPLPVVELEIVDASSGGPVLGPVRVVRGGAAADAAGRATVDFDTRQFPTDAPAGVAFPAGSCRFTVVALGYAAGEEVELDLAPGERRRVLVELPPAPGSTGRVRLRFRDPSGRPVPPERVPFCGVTAWGLVDAVPPEDAEGLEFVASAGAVEFTPGADPDAQDPANPWVRRTISVVVEPGGFEDRVVDLEAGGWLRLRGVEEDPGDTYLLRGGEVRVERWRAGEDATGTHWIAGPLPPGPWTLSFPEELGVEDLEADVAAAEVRDLRVEATRR